MLRPLETSSSKTVVAFGFGSTCDDVLIDRNVRSKIVIITGATSGLGFETARSLASVGAYVVVAGRSAASVTKAVAELSAMVPGGAFDGVLLDLASLASVERAAEGVRSKYPRIDILINNAGVMATPRSSTVDGHEVQFGTNHLGHFMFATQLGSALDDGSRIVALSSSAHRFSSVDLDDIDFSTRPYDPWIAYGQSKTANIWFASEFQRRFGDRGVLAFSVHPGAIMTNLQRHATPENRAELSLLTVGSGGLVLKTPAQGAATTCWAATAPELIDHGGAYLEDCHVAGPIDPAVSRGGYATWAYDVQNAARLWEVSETLVNR